jgi:ABC-type sugar transport system ATPase subunit
MNRLTQRGVAIIMISSEMLEILAIADRIIVMRRPIHCRVQGGEASKKTPAQRQLSDGE